MSQTKIYIKLSICGNFLAIKGAIISKIGSSELQVLKSPGFEKSMYPHDESLERPKLRDVLRNLRD